MQINDLPNKYKILQEFYLYVKEERISYDEALELFYKLSGQDKEDFEEYYRDETGYEIISSAKGFNLNPGINTGNLGEFTKNLIRTKYTLDAYAKGNGLIIDSIWSQYSYEEILELEATGVYIPQDVLDIAHTMQEQNAQTVEPVEGEADEENVVEKEPYLELIPKAQKKIKKTNDNGKKIEDAVQELIPEQQKQEKNILSRLKKQRKSLEEYEAFIREWRTLQNKINSGEPLSDSESKRYARLTGMMSGEDRTDDLKIDKREIAKSLNEINILATLGEKLADETIEIGEELADYTCKSNFKATRKTVAAEIGYTKSMMAMVKGKTLAKDAIQIGHLAQDYTEETKRSVNDIAGLLEIEGSIADLGSATPEKPEQPTEMPESDAEKTENLEKAGEAKAEEKTEEVEEETKTEDQEAKEIDPSEAPVDTAETENSDELENKDFIITDETVKELLKDAQEVNSELLKQIFMAVISIKIAKSDMKFAQIAGKRIDKLVAVYNKIEEIRQQEIERKNKENEESYKEIENLTGKSKDEVDEELSNGNSKENDDNSIVSKYGVDAKQDDETKEKVKEHKEKIINNNKDIEGIKADSEKAKDKFKADTKKEKNVLDNIVPEDNELLKLNEEYDSEIIPEDKETLGFAAATGTTLKRMGKAVVKMGVEEISAAYIMMLFSPTSAFLLLTKGIYDTSRGTRSMVIGANTHREGTKKYDKRAEKLTGKAVNDLKDAIGNLNEVDEKIVSITGDESAQSEYDAQNIAEEEVQETNETASPEDTTENAPEEEAQAKEVEQQEATLEQATQTMTNVNVQASVNDLSQPASTPASATSSAPTAPTATAQAPAAETQTTTNAGSQNIMTSNTMGIGNKNDENKEEAASQITKSSNNSSKSNKSSNKKEEEQQKTITNADVKSATKEVQKNTQEIKDTNKEAKSDNKESLKIKKDEEKTEKQLVKEAKQLEKEIQREQKEIEAHQKETEQIQQRQMELAAQFEELDLQNEQLMTEAQASISQQQNSQPQQGAQGAQQGGMATNSFQMQPAGGENSAVAGKIEQISANNAQIALMGAEYKSNNQKITRNKQLINISSKFIKSAGRAFNKKVKAADKKSKARQKAEEAKQRKLQKKLAAIGVAENVFSLLNSGATTLKYIGIGLSKAGLVIKAVGQGMLSNPWTAAAGAILVATGTAMDIAGNISQLIGLYGSKIALFGTLACGIAKATVLIASGNLQAGLMAIGVSIVSAAASLAGGNNSMSAGLEYATQALQTVQAAANLGNSVREFKGKEESNLLSGISAVAGIASAVTSATSSAGGLTKGKTLDNIISIAGTAGSTLSTSAEVINTSRQLAGKEGDSKVANILGLAGMGLSMTSSVLSIGASAANGIKNARNNRQAKKAQSSKAVSKRVSEVSNKNVETPKFQAAPQEEIKGNVNLNMDNMKTLDPTTTSQGTVNNANKTSNNGPKVDEKTGKLEGLKEFDSVGFKAADTNTELKTATTKAMDDFGKNMKIEAPKFQPKKQSFGQKMSNAMKKTQPYIQAVGAATQLTSSIMSMKNNNNEQAAQENQKKPAQPIKLSKRMKEIMKKTRKMKQRKVLKKSSTSKYYGSNR